MINLLLIALIRDLAFTLRQKVEMTDYNSIDHISKDLFSSVVLSISAIDSVKTGIVRWGAIPSRSRTKDCVSRKNTGLKN